MKTFTLTTLIANSLAFDAYTFMHETTVATVNSSLAKSDPSCWKLAYGRGVGKPIHTCADGLE